MSADKTDAEPREGTQGFQAVPRGRARRFGRFARLAGGGVPPEFIANLASGRINDGDRQAIGRMRGGTKFGAHVTR